MITLNHDSKVSSDASLYKLDQCIEHFSFLLKVVHVFCDEEEWPAQRLLCLQSRNR